MNFINNISPVEFTLIVVVLFILFGKKALVKLGKTSGETVREMKNIKQGFMDAVNSDEPAAKKEVEN